MSFTPEDIAQRKPVWVALSDLFLDTDVTLNYGYIVQECAKSPYSLEQLRAILKDEVAPVVSVNLLNVAGEWAGFNEQWLVEQICDYGASKGTVKKAVMKPLNHWVFKNYIDEHWQVLATKIAAARNL